MMSESALRSIAILVAAVACGMLAAYATMRLLGERSVGLPDRWTVGAIAEAPGGVRVLLEGGRALRVDTAASPANARNLALFYPGKMVTLTEATRTESGGRCLMLVPLLQADRPVLSPERHAQLRAAGLSDPDLAVSFELPQETAAAGGDTAGEPAVRGICATEPWSRTVA